eukprot:9374993-Pyramimonas_sp.AAC.1
MSREKQADANTGATEAAQLEAAEKAEAMRGAADEMRARASAELAEVEKEEGEVKVAASHMDIHI